MINCKGLDLIHRSMSDFAIHPTGRALSTPPPQTRRQEMNGALRSPEAVTESSNSTFIHLNLVRGASQRAAKPAAVACSRTASRAIFAAHGERSDPGKGSQRVVEPPRRLDLASRLRRRRRRFANHAAPFQFPRGSPNLVHFTWPRLQLVRQATTRLPR